MFVLFEEDGGFKVGTLLSAAESSMQVEMSTGKRSKIKRNVVLMEFQTPMRDELIPKARELSAQLEPQFLWDVAPDEEFDGQEFAKEIFNASAGPIERAATLISLHDAPMFFYRKGRGRYRRAPADALKAALAGAERKRLAAQAQQAMHEALVAGSVPQEIASEAISLLVKPDKQSIQFKALESAAHELQMTPARLLMSRGALPSMYSLHFARFMHQCSVRSQPQANLDAFEAASQEAISAATAASLTLATQKAYSIDDVTTTEIDDAFSLTELDGGGVRVGIHIAAPGLGITPDNPLGLHARERASTVYFPGDKITMLPASVISAYSLDEGCVRPAVSLYVDFNDQGERIATQSKVERILIEKNIRLGDWESALESESADIDESMLPWAGLKTLLTLSLKLREGRESVRGRPEPTGRTDFNFYVDWNTANPDAMKVGDGTPRIVMRKRGSPVDTLVSEFMILANTCWGDMLALARLPGIYRVQQMGRVRMQTQPGPHQGLGVSNYAWSTSPLRRFSDLLNQWQILAALGQRKPVFKGNEADLFSAVNQFDTLYNQYADFQDTLERYWSLRWLALEYGLGGTESWSAVASRVKILERAVALRDGALRLRRVPIVVRCADAPVLAPGVEVELELLSADALDLSVQARFISVTSSVPVVEEEIAVLSERYAVLGSPISHSKSPWIHARFAAQTGQTMDYAAHQVGLKELSAYLDQFIAEGYGGVNLTVPLKEEAYAIAQSRDWEISERASSARAVNTLRFDSNGWVLADNTDGLGLVRDLERHLHPGALEGMRVLLIGAGGAAQGVIGALRQAGVSHIRLSNRSLDKAQLIADHWNKLDASVSEWLSVLPLSLLAEPQQIAAGDEPHDVLDEIIINATSASLAGEGIAIHESRFSRAQIVLDMMYGAQPTLFMQAASQAGAPKVADGLGMLVEQAAEAFFIWRGVRPQTEAVLSELRLQLTA